MGGRNRESLAGIEELRRAVELLDRNNEGSNAGFSAEELLNIARACWASGWDVWPDEWTSQQVEAAAKDKTPPRFEERPNGLHALDVTDCVCRDCRRAVFAALEREEVSS